MAQTRDLVVRILSDTSKLNAGMNEANGKLGALGRTAKIAGAAFAAYAAGDVVIDFLGESAKAAEEDKKSQAELARQLKVSTGATEANIAVIEDQIGALSRATGVADDDLRPAYAALARASGDTETAQSELAIAMDIAAARGVDLATVTTALEKAHNGNVGALGRLGVATKDAEGNTLSLDAAMAQAAKTYEGAAEAAVTPGQRMSVAFAELKEQIGTALLPVLENLSTFMADTLLPAFQDAIVWVQENWPKIEKAIQKTVDVVKPILDGLFTFIATQFKIISGIIEVFVNLLHGDFSGAWEAIQGVVDTAMNAVKSLVSSAVEFVKETFGGIVEAVAGIPARIATVAVGMFDGVRDAAVALARGVKEAVEDIIGFFLSIPKRIAGLGAKILAEITGGAGGLVTKAIGMIPGLAEGGIVTKPTLALIGERGPEAVVPLRGTRTASDFDRPLGGGSGAGGTTINIGTLVSSANNVEQLIADINNYARRNGGLRVPGGVTAVS